MAVRTVLLPEDRASSALQFGGSLYFNREYSEHLRRSPGSSGDRRKMTFSYWTKRLRPGTYEYIITSYNGSNTDRIGFTSDNQFFIELKDGGSTEAEFHSDRTFADPSGWYHCVVVFDTDLSTAADRCKVWVNGEQITSWDTNDTIGQYYEMAGFNVSGKMHSIGRYQSDTTTGGSGYYDGYICDFHFVDGSALDATYFGFTDSLTNTWRPKKYEYNVTDDLTTEANNIYSSQQSSDGQVATNAFDGILTDAFASRWRNNSSTDGNLVNNEYVGQDFGSGVAKDIREMRLLQGRASSTGEMITGVKIQYSDNGSAWSDASASTTIDASTFAWQTIKAGPSGAHRYWRLLCTAASNSVWCITELTMHEYKDSPQYGTTGYYLPFDGSDEIGRDKSGNGCHWGPQNSIRNTATIDRASGAFPILNTVCGGNKATVGVRSDSYAPGHLVYANPFCGISTDVAYQANGGVNGHQLSMTGSLPGVDQNRVYPNNFYDTAFYLDGNDCVYSADSSDWDLGSGDFTAEIWFKRNRVSQDEWIFTQSDGVGSNTPFGIHIDSSANVIEGRVYHGSTETDIAGTTVLNDKKWYHAAWVRDGNTMRLFMNGVQENSTTISGSVVNGTSPLLVGAVVSDGTAGFQGWVQDARLYKGVAKYKHNFVPASTDPQILAESPSGSAIETNFENECGSISFDGTDDDITWSHADFAFPGAYTMECWFYVRKIGAQHMTIIGNYQSSGQGNFIELYANAELYVHLYSPNNTHHDTGAKVPLHAWNHVALVREGLGTGQVHCYLNGKRTPNSMTEDTDWGSSARAFRIGALDGSATYDFNGFVSNVRVVKGTAVYTSDFIPPKGPLENITNTVLLACQSTTAIEYAVSPNTPTVNGSPQISTFNPFKCDTICNSDTFPTLNPLSASDVTNGTIMYKNLWLEGSNYYKQQANIRFGPGSITDGKYYWEITPSDGTYPGYSGIESDFEQDSGEIWGNNTRNWMGNGAYKPFTTSGANTSDSRIPYYDGQTYGFAVDVTANKMHFYREGHLIFTDTTIPDASTTAYEPLIFATNDGSGGSGWADMDINFGQRPFKYPAPEGYRSLGYSNLPQPEFPRPDSVVGIVTYTGNGSTGQSIPLNFQPDFVLTKKYSGTESWGGFDSISGAGKRWYFNGDNDQATENTFTSFNKKGFSVTGAGGGSTNDNNDSYIAYAWKAGGNKATWNVDGLGYASVAAAGLDGGSINPTGASVNTKAGFSIIRYESTAANPESYAHGLTRKPEFMFVKKTGATGKDGGGGDRGWSTFHHSLDDGKVLFMDTDGDHYTEPNFWHNNGGITDSLVYVGGDYNTGDNDGAEYVGFAWHGVPGLQQFGKYPGNGSTDGCYVHLGFRPALIFLKMYTSSDSWAIMTPKLNSPLMNNSGYASNVSSHLRADATGGEYNPGGSPAVELDFLANGFKHKNSSGQVNADAQWYVYCAWAEAPLNNLYGGVPNAR